MIDYLRKFIKRFYIFTDMSYLKIAIWLKNKKNGDFALKIPVLKIRRLPSVL